MNQQQLVPCIPLEQQSEHLRSCCSSPHNRVMNKCTGHMVRPVHAFSRHAQPTLIQQA